MGGLSGRMAPGACSGLWLLAFVLGFGSVHGQSRSEGLSSHSVAGKPSAKLASKFAHWRLKFEKGDPIDAPEKGEFSSYSSLADGGTAHLLNDSATAAPVKLTGVVKRIRYIPAADPPDPGDKVITQGVTDALAAPEILKFVASRHIDSPRLNVEKDLAVVLVQGFDAALRTPRKKEHIWSINWRVDSGQGDPDYVGYEVWGLFTKVDGVLKPFYLVGNLCGEIPMSSYYYILAVGDLDGDGIDEFVARNVVYEAEEDSLEIFAWERGAPVSVHKMAFDR